MGPLNKKKLAYLLCVEIKSGMDLESLAVEVLKIMLRLKRSEHKGEGALKSD